MFSIIYYFAGIIHSDDFSSRAWDSTRGSTGIFYSSSPVPLNHLLRLSLFFHDDLSCYLRAASRGLGKSALRMIKYVHSETWSAMGHGGSFHVSHCNFRLAVQWWFEHFIAFHDMTVFFLCLSVFGFVHLQSLMRKSRRWFSLIFFILQQNNRCELRFLHYWFSDFTTCLTFLIIYSYVSFCTSFCSK
jgi:hypothetical protein